MIHATMLQTQNATVRFPVDVRNSPMGNFSSLPDKILNGKGELSLG